LCAVRICEGGFDGVTSIIEVVDLFLIFVEDSVTDRCEDAPALQWGIEQQCITQ
jgi:hypothetical protein